MHIEIQPVSAQLALSVTLTNHALALLEFQNCAVQDHVVLTLIATSSIIKNNAIVNLITSEMPILDVDYSLPVHAFLIPAV